MKFQLITTAVAIFAATAAALPTPMIDNQAIDIRAGRVVDETSIEAVTARGLDALDSRAPFDLGGDDDDVVAGTIETRDDMHATETGEGPELFDRKEDDGDETVHAAVDARDARKTTTETTLKYWMTKSISWMGGAPSERTAVLYFHSYL
ncbi:hypothetical protein VTH06DRAFT_4896 [Thermothelomyces fergusii]